MYLSDAFPIPWRFRTSFERALRRLLSFEQPLEHLEIQPGQPEASLIAVGDLSFYDAKSYDPDYVLTDAKHIWDRADARVGNLETVCTRRTQPVGSLGGYLRANPEAIDFLRSAKVTAVNVANNHALDYGSAALAESSGYLQAAGIAVCGMSRSPAEIAHPALLQIQGVRIAMIGFCDHFSPPVSEPIYECPAEADEETMCLAVRNAVGDNDIVIVQLHWGYEFAVHPLRRHRDLARRLINCGADMVLCHHAHVPMGLEAIGNGFIAHGLGNCLFSLKDYQTLNHDWTSLSYFLEVQFSRAGVQRVSVHPYELLPGSRIRLLHGRRRHSFLAAIRRMSDRLEDTSWLDRVERSRMVYEGCETTSRLYNASDADLTERVMLLRTPVNRQLVLGLLSLNNPGASEVARLFTTLAEIGDDLGELRRVLAERKTSIMEQAVPALMRLYSWRDALMSKLP